MTKTVYKNGKLYDCTFPIYDCEMCVAKQYRFCNWAKGSNECDSVHIMMSDFKILDRTKET